MKQYGFLCIALLILVSCSGDDKTQNVVIENRYSMDIPTSLTKTDNLNQEASLQYQNVFKELYIIVIDEAKKDIFDAINQNNLSETYSADFEGYTKLVMDGYSQKMTIKEKSNPTDTLANGLKIRKVSLTSVYNGIDAFMMLGFVEGKERYYQIFTWTLAKRKDKHEQKMVKMINSFKEL